MQLKIPSPISKQEMEGGEGDDWKESPSGWAEWVIKMSFLNDNNCNVSV